jgi:L-ribulose-5-phosphate 3-epimerase
MVGPREKFKLAFSLVVQDDASALRVIESIHAAGFQGIEPTFGLESTLPTAADPAASAAKLRSIADRVGLKIPSMRGGPGFWSTFASDDAAKRKSAVALAAKALDAVKTMGGDTLLIVPGQWEPHQTYAAMWDNALDTARRIAELAEKASVNVGLENVENRFLLSPREWMQFLDEVGSPRVRMYFDVGNVVYLRLGPPEQWIRQLGKKYISRIHFKDAGVGGPLTYLLEGAVNWPAVREALRAIGYDDWIGIELNLPAHHSGAMLAGTYRAAEQILAGEKP